MKRSKAAAFLLALVFLFSCGVQAAFAGDALKVQVKADFKYDEARKMLKLINEFRTGSDAWQLAEDNETRVQITGLKALEYDYNLERAAMQRAVEIAAYFSHTRPDGSSWSAVFPSGYSAKGENICYGYGSASSAFDAFAEEDKNYAGQGHRRNMLRKEFTKVGFGCVKVGNMVYWAQSFGSGGSSGADSNRYSSNQVSASSDILVKNARGVMPESESLSLKVGESVSLPNVIITSNTGARLTLKDVSWKTADKKIAKVKDKKVTGAAAGKTSLTAKVGGSSLQLPVTVTKKDGKGKGKGADEDLLDVIDDYDPPLAGEYIFVLEDDECFELELE